MPIAKSPSWAVPVIGDVITKTYTKKASADWKIANCSLVAFVYDPDTQEILQAETRHIGEDE